MSTTVGELLRIARRERGLTLREVATALSISFPYIAEIENGTRRGSPAMLRRLADQLGIDPVVLRNCYMLDAKHEAAERWDAARPDGDGETA